MAQNAIVPIGRLDAGLILAPERYDPRRRLMQSGGVYVTDIADVVAEHVTPSKGAGRELFLVLDTGDAHEGVIGAAKKLVTLAEIGSNKKRLRPGDVIISRLRPYLRQVAFVDDGLFSFSESPIGVISSTEFFVLRSKTTESIAFLVPLLLTTAVQVQLAAAQEGGHHPRFNQGVLRSLTVRRPVFEARASISAQVEQAVALYRQSEREIWRLCKVCEEAG